MRLRSLCSIPEALRIAFLARAYSFTYEEQKQQLGIESKEWCF